MNVTRDVVRDLWVLREAGEASDDSKRLLDAFLASDPAFAETLRSGSSVWTAPAPPTLPPDHDARTLDRARRRLDRRSPFRILAVGFTGLALARLVEATTFTKSPAEVIGLGIASAACWVLYGWHTRRLQRQAVFGSGS
jgi:ferric-dicitrate binding protein FerR (iron transport regulator)